MAAQSLAVSITQQDVLPGASRVGAIDYDTLQQWLAKINAAKMLLILDTCEAGASEFIKGDCPRGDDGPA
jgi:hypothetical protein